MRAKMKSTAKVCLAIGALIGMGACAQLPVQMPTASPAPAAPASTWVGSTQVFVFCPGNKLLVLDPSMRTQWCQGTYAADGQISANCNVNGRTHSSAGRCTMSGGTMTCNCTANNQPYSFNFTRGSGGVCS